jgi:hypothetical protein
MRRVWTMVNFRAGGGQQVREAMVKAHGVVMAIPREQSRVPHPPTG